MDNRNLEELKAQLQEASVPLQSLPLLQEAIHKISSYHISFSKLLLREVLARFLEIMRLIFSLLYDIIYYVGVCPYYFDGLCLNSGGFPPRKDLLI